MASVTQAEKERDGAKQEARVDQLVVTSVGDAKARVEVNISKALKSLAAAKESEHRSKAEIASLKTKLTHVEVE